MSFSREFVPFNGAQRHGTRSDGWQQIDWWQGTGASGGLQWQWRDWTVQACECVCARRMNTKHGIPILERSGHSLRHTKIVQSAQKGNWNVWKCRTGLKTERQLVFTGLTCVRSYKNKQTNKNKKQTNTQINKKSCIAVKNGQMETELTLIKAGKNKPGKLNIYWLK